MRGFVALVGMCWLGSTPIGRADFRSGPGLIAQGSVQELLGRASMMVTVISVASSVMSPQSETARWLAGLARETLSTQQASLYVFCWIINSLSCG